MTYRTTFDCLFCGTTWTTRGADDLEGWAWLCPECLGKAATSRFLKDRLRAGLAARASAAATSAAATTTPAADAATRAAPASTAAAPASTSTSPSASAPRPAARPAPGRLVHPAFPDDWFLRRGPFERGAIHDTAWAAELDMVTRWVDALPLGGRIHEPAAGVGFFSPLLAEKGELHASDADGGALDLARSRLLAHRLRAHLHTADPWAAPAPGDEADALVGAFLLGRVRGAGLDSAASALARRLRPGGLLALVDLRPDPAGGPPPGIPWVNHEPSLVDAALVRAGFADLQGSSTGRFFALRTARRA